MSLIAAVRRRWWVVVLLALLGAGLGAIPAAERSVDATTTWTASRTLLLSSSAVGRSVFSDPVAEKLDYPGVPAALAGQVTVTIDGNNAALRIATTQQTADAAVEIADVW